MKGTIVNLRTIDTPNLSQKYLDLHLNKLCEVSGDTDVGFIVESEGGEVGTFINPMVHIDFFGQIEIVGFVLDTPTHYCRLSVIIKV